MAEVDQENGEDIALMAKIAIGDEAAFARLIEKHQNTVVGTVTKMTNFSPDAEDLAQQVFLRIWKSAHRYQPTAKFTTYLFTIVKNLVFNHTKKNSRRKEQSLDEQEEEWHQQAAVDNSARPDQALAQAELQRTVENAISQLPEKQKLAVILRRQEKMPYEEMANILEISVPAVKSTLFRARSTLRKLLHPYLDD